jgi:SlyX protein
VTDPVEDLQIRVEHQEMAIEELNRTVTFQARRLTELEAELASLRDRLRALQPSPLGDGDAQEIPPHY